MGNLLSLKIGNTIEISGIYTNTVSKFICKDIVSYENNYNYNSNRYTLFSVDSKKYYRLDVSKNYYGDIDITLLNLIEELEFDLNFFSLLGTSPLAYNHPDIQHLDYILYKYKKSPISTYETIKYFVNKDDLPKSYKEYGYFQDGNSNWYFLTKKYEPSLIKCDHEYKYIWQYEQSDNEILTIEIITYNSVLKYLEKKPNFMIYTGKKLSRKNIRSINKEYMKISI